MLGGGAGWLGVRATPAMEYAHWRASESQVRWSIRVGTEEERREGEEEGGE